MIGLTMWNFPNRCPVHRLDLNASLTCVIYPFSLFLILFSEIQQSTNHIFAKNQNAKAKDEKEESEIQKLDGDMI